MAASPQPAPVRRRRPNGVLTRALVGATALLLFGLSIREAVWRSHQSAALRALLVETGLDRRQPDLADAILAEPDPVRGRLAVARALVNEAVDMSGFANLPPREAAEAAALVGSRLELAETLATEAHRERPAAWQASMLVGAARYLMWSRSGDPKLFERRSEWEEPLIRAVATAPEEEEPLRLLAVTRLELWPALSAAERSRAREVLRNAFQDPGASQKLLATWLHVAGSTEEALAILPQRSETWATVARSFATDRDWGAYIEILHHQDRIRRRELDAQVREIGERLSGGDAVTARRLAMQLLGAAPLDRDGADVVARVVGLLPPAAASSEKAGAVWVRWTGMRLVRGLPGLPPAVAARLLGWTGTLPPEEQALGKLAAGDLSGAEQLERRSEETNLEGWAPYFIAKARLLAEFGDLAAARASLAQVHRAWRKRPAALHAAVLVAEKQGGEAGAVARQELVQVAAAAWQGTAWLWESGRAELEIELMHAVAGLAIKIDLAPPAGAVVSVRIDDLPRELQLATAGAVVEIRKALQPGIHIIEVSTVTTG
ncbi:MAG TPA: hypothetical protein PLS53_01050, partial [Thermoanaerobaculaceae bacterium]|nr:hypothetical protein [Thermoanaerobaculaceae bacterium]